MAEQITKPNIQDTAQYYSIKVYKRNFKRQAKPTVTDSWIRRYNILKTMDDYSFSGLDDGKGITQTRIMFGINSEYKATLESLSELEKSGCIIETIIPNKTTHKTYYRLTDKGRQLLLIYERINENFLPLESLRRVFRKCQ